MTERDELLAELWQLSRELGVHTEWLASSGATGLPKATRELAEQRGWQPPSDSEPRRPRSAESEARGSADAPSGGALRQPAPAAEPAQPASAVAARATPAARVSADAPGGALRQPAPAEEPTPPAAVARPSAATLSADERARRLTVLADEVKGCQGCGLHESRTQTVFARGNGRSGLCFVGEGPGADEDAQGYPFVGAAGQLLDKMITAMGLDRDEVYVCNIVKCRPPKNRKPTPEEMAACMPYLEQQLELVAPEVIVALGATAVQGLLGTSGGITRLRGNWRLYQGRIAVMPTFHPAYLLRTPRAKRDVWNDLQAVLRHMGRPIPGKP